MTEEKLQKAVHHLFACCVGLLVSDFLQSGPDVTSLGYCRDVMSDAQDYSGFNLITVNLRLS